MNKRLTIKLIAALAVNTWTSSLFAHIVLENKAAPVASSYKAVLQALKLPAALLQVTASVGTRPASSAMPDVCPSIDHGKH